MSWLLGLVLILCAASLVGAWLRAEEVRRGRAAGGAAIPPGVLTEPLRAGDIVIFPPVVTNGEQLAATLAPYSGKPGAEVWRCEYLPHAVPHQFRHLRNPDGTPNRAAFAVLRGDTLAPYVTAPREGEGTMHTDPPTPRPEPGTPPPPPDA